MAELPVAAGLTVQTPPVVLEKLDDVADFHQLVRRSVALGFTRST